MSEANPLENPVEEIIAQEKLKRGREKKGKLGKFASDDLHLPKGHKSEKAGKGKKTRETTFSYEGVDREGNEAKGVIQASAYSEAKFKLEHQGISVTRLTLRKSWTKLEFGRIVPLAVVLQATRQLASFAEAGIPVSRGLEVLSTSVEHPRMRQCLEEIKVEIEAGTTFSEALAHQGNIFPFYFSAIIGSAERTGDISEALVSLNDYLERDLRSARAVRAALNYPAVLFALAIVAVTILSAVVLPRFETFFASLNVKLPLPTRMLLGATHLLSTYWWALALLTIAAITGYMFAKRNPRGEKVIDVVKMRVPIMGPLVRLVAVERFCRVLATLVRSQVPLPDALSMAGKATGNRVFRDGIEVAKDAVVNGEGLAGPLADIGCFPPVAIQIFKVGEDSGQLEEQMVQASSFYSDELDYRMKNFTALIEPIVLLVLGLGIGFVAVALISAMYGIYAGVQQ